MSSNPLLPSRSLRSRVHKFIVEHDLIRPGDRLLVGVSGGPDSTALMLLLASLRRSLSFELEAAHFDHRLRSRRAAASEERFVLDLANRLDVPLHTGAGDVKTRSKSKHESMEQAARGLRYRFLASAAAKAGCRIVAVGHTLDDQAETVLLHLLRGSGLRGLAGMAPHSPWPIAISAAPRLIRPLLQLSHSDTAACCRHAGLSAVDDPSNRSAKHTRSRVRHQLLPLLREFNPRIESALARLAALTADDVEVLEELAADAIRKSSSKGEVRIDRRRLSGLPASLQRHAVRLAFKRLLGDIRNLSERHIRAVVAANAGGAGVRLHLPRKVHVQVQRASIVLSTASKAPGPLPKRSVALPIPGSISYGSWKIRSELLRRKPRTLGEEEGLLAVPDADACGTLRLRRRRAGDRFQPLGMQREKKLQDFFVDARVPRDFRDSLPILDTKRGIAWVVTQRPAEWAKVTKDTKRYLRISARS